MENLESRRAAVLPARESRSPVHTDASNEGSSMPYIITLNAVDGSLKGEPFAFSAPARILVGRSNACDVRLPSDPLHWDISRRHCLIAALGPWHNDPRSGQPQRHLCQRTEDRSSTLLPSGRGGPRRILPAASPVRRRPHPGRANDLSGRDTPGRGGGGGREGCAGRPTGGERIKEDGPGGPRAVRVPHVRNRPPPRRIRRRVVRLSAFFARTLRKRSRTQAPWSRDLGHGPCFT